MSNTESGSPNEPLTIEESVAFNAKLPTGDGSVRCLVCGEELQFVTFTHLASHATGPTSLEEYKGVVAQTLDIDEDDVPVVSSDLQQRLAERTRERWEDGEYDHFRMV